MLTFSLFCGTIFYTRPWGSSSSSASRSSQRHSSGAGYVKVTHSSWAESPETSTPTSPPFTKPHKELYWHAKHSCFHLSLRRAAVALNGAARWVTAPSKSLNSSLAFSPQLRLLPNRRASDISAPRTWAPATRGHYKHLTRAREEETGYLTVVLCASKSHQLGSWSLAENKRNHTLRDVFGVCKNLKLSWGNVTPETFIVPFAGCLKVEINILSPYSHLHVMWGLKDDTYCQYFYSDYRFNTLTVKMNIEIWNDFQ